MKTAAYQEGWDAYKNYNFPVECPYEFGTIEYKDWSMGWDDAFDYWNRSDSET